MTLEKEIPHAKLGLKIINIGINGVKGAVRYLPLYLIGETSVLKFLNLPNDEFKARVEPEDLSFGELKKLVCEDRKMRGAVSVTCPELDETITKDRDFHTAIHVLLERGSKIEFMFWDDELVSLKVLARSLCLDERADC